MLPLFLGGFARRCAIRSQVVFSGLQNSDGLDVMQAGAELSELL